MEICNSNILRFFFFFFYPFVFSVSSNSPVWWLMDGPRTINHDFSSSFCEATLSMTIHNRSPIAVSVRIATFDSLPDTSHSSDAVQVLDSSENQGGWQDVPLVSELKGISDVPGAHARKPKSQSIAPFVWCASSSTQLNLDPECTIEVPLRICLFSPGTYDLSNYELHWKLQPADGVLPNDLKRFSAGMSRGHPFYLTALQSPAVAQE